MSELLDAGDSIIMPPREGDTYTPEDLEYAVEQGEINRDEMNYRLSPPRARPAMGTRPSWADPNKPNIKLRPTPVPRDWRERMAADQPPPHMRKPQLGDN